VFSYPETPQRWQLRSSSCLPFSAYPHFQSECYPCYIHFQVRLLDLLQTKQYVYYTGIESHLERLSALGTGLLLGAALGVIIPEYVQPRVFSLIHNGIRGIEAIAAAHKDGLPTGRIALCLVVGFTLMLIIEQLISPHSHSHSPNDSISFIQNKPSFHDSALDVEFDAELGDIGLENPSDRRLDPPPTANTLEVSTDRERAFALLLGLVIHGIADGLALGVAHVAGSSSGSTNTLSLVVFFALILHKGQLLVNLLQSKLTLSKLKIAPTTLAFTTSIISTNIPRSKCKKYVAIFSLSTPLSALMTYTISSFLGKGDKGDLAGLALLVSVRYLSYISFILSSPNVHPGRYIFVCLHRTPTIITSFACGWRDATNDTRIHYCLWNVCSSCIQSIIRLWTLNCTVPLCQSN
jgi:solute carrier family 39 (zinc transporter), member 9